MKPVLGDAEWIATEWYVIYQEDVIVAKRCNETLMASCRMDIRDTSREEKAL